MTIFNRVSARLLACCIAGMAMLGALALAPAAGAATNLGSTYLALGDSLSYGYHQAQFNKELKEKGFVEPANYHEGFVDDFAAFLKQSRPSLTYINDGCPGETTETFVKGSGTEGDCAGGPTGTPFPFVFLHHPYKTKTQLEDAKALLAENPNISPITLNLGSNDVLQFLEHTCGFPAKDTCTETELGTEYIKIAGNIGSIVSQLHTAAPNAQIEFIAAYNPFPAVIEGGNRGLTTLNNLIAGQIAKTPNTIFTTSAPVFNPSIVTGGPETEDIPTICAYTAMCPGGVYNPSSPEADIHPTTLGYHVMAEILEVGFPAPRYTTNNLVVGSGPEPVVNWGTLTLNTVAGGSGSVTCRVVGAGTADNPNPVIGGGANSTQVFAPYDCVSTTCPHTSSVTAEGLPWSTVLHQEGGTVRVATSGVKLNVACKNGEVTESASRFVGTTEPISQKGMSAMHPSYFEFDPASGELEMEGSGGSVLDKVEGKLKTLGEEEQDLVNTRTG